MNEIDLIIQLKKYGHPEIGYNITSTDEVWIDKPIDILNFLEAENKIKWCLDFWGIPQAIYNQYKAWEKSYWQCHGVTSSGKRCKKSVYHGYGPKIKTFIRNEHKTMCIWHEEQEFDL
jgi:hypothetical protein